MVELNEDLCFLFLSGMALLAASLFIIVRRGREGAMILVLILLSGVVSSTIFAGMFPGAVPVYLSSVPVFSAAAVIIYIFFGRGSHAERFFTAAVLFSSCLQAGFGIYDGVAEPGAVIAGIMAGSISAALFYTVFSWVVKYHSSIHQ